MEDKISGIKKTYLDKISSAKSLGDLDEIFLALFGKSGEITQIPKEFSKIPKEDLKTIAPLFIQTKKELEEAIEKRREEVREEKYAKLSDEKIVLQPVLQPERLQAKIKSDGGHLHPITQLEHEITELFRKLGFQQFNAPHIDTTKYNFELLNIPEGHPAMDLWDTLYVECKKCNVNPGELLLRTHTSNAQVRIMEQNKPPIRMMILDRCFRYENLDARHEHTFDQFEIVYIDKKVNMTNLQYLSEYFLKAIFGTDIKVRMLPKYYPFVEPGAAVEGQCIFCKGKGCKICSKGWLELTGAGMIHPQVLKNGGIDPNIYSGIAWGFGIYRIALLKYGVPDVRQFLSGDLKFLEKY
ncbi:phenylalanine--tRNA ligase subunit alpha [Candidatus Daviesbacteria bacterium RIFOXYD1_FULL_41_10]|uniref:phenylalanine--tRNA ligase n=1 Tax=Candidatus Daviesbacteria bacterium RIFOXYD1_FULL_41_10 TaxID=1797801 RepID=A0A1F5N2M6_9BACT|nr:MAG: phenylalanine--tRNA ligase subunit alpha [Candidatus Daviesbacteria bacterium RIFOXYD1_FULL_41_10]